MTDDAEAGSTNTPSVAASWRYAGQGYHVGIAEADVD